MKTMCDVKGVVTVEMHEIISACNDGGADGFFDLLAKKAGHELLLDIDYSILSAEGPATLKIEVTGCIEVEDEDGEKPPAAS
jgi:hypothetical protein